MGRPIGNPRDSGERRHSVRVWDLPTRLFHWLLAATVAFELATGLLAPKWWFGRHIWVGYAIAALLAFRVVWAFFGSGHSRLRDFAYPPRLAVEHLRAMARRGPAHYLGHNPAGAMMIFALIFMLTALVVTGILVQGGYLKQGPAAGFTSFAAGDVLRSIHQLVAWAILGLILVHLAGVFVGSFAFRERLIGAMIDGKKLLAPGEHARAVAAPKIAPAIAWLAGAGVVAAASLALLSGLPAVGVPDMPISAAVNDECGACHHVFHPSLLPRASWTGIMNGLAQHFGEDASLPQARKDEIAAFLQKYSAEAWDTLAARRFSKVSPEDPLRITATPAWRRIHRHIEPATFGKPAVGSKANCTACHRDADSGRFAPQAINPSPGS